MIREMNFVFLGVEEKISKKSGNPYRVVKFGDAEQYESIELMLDDSVPTEGLKKGDNVVVAVDIRVQGFNLRMNPKSIDLLGMKNMKNRAV